MSPYHNQLESILVHHNQVPLMLCFLVEEALLRKMIRNQLRPFIYKTKTEKKEESTCRNQIYAEQYNEWKHRDYVIACSAPKCPGTMYDCQILQYGISYTISFPDHASSVVKKLSSRW